MSNAPESLLQEVASEASPPSPTVGHQSRDVSGSLNSLDLRHRRHGAWCATLPTALSTRDGPVAARQPWCGNNGGDVAWDDDGRPSPAIAHCQPAHNQLQQPRTGDRFEPVVDLSSKSVNGKPTVDFDAV
jgi:hypothetical protein